MSLKAGRSPNGADAGNGSKAGGTWMRRESSPMATE
jgi:hypothetical protein